MFQLLIGVVFGGITASIAHGKGRNALGWFFGGFFGGCIGLIIILCLSDLNEDNAKWQNQQTENRRLREQLRQEQMRGEALREHTVARLDAHDDHLGVDTRSAAPQALPGPAAPGAAPQIAVGSAGASAQWYYSVANEAVGPVDIAQIGLLIRGGEVVQTTNVWHDEADDWKPAGEMRELDQFWV